MKWRTQRVFRAVLFIAGFVMTGKSFYQWVWPPHATFCHPTLCDIFVRNIASEFKRIVSNCVKLHLIGSNSVCVFAISSTFVVGIGSLLSRNPVPRGSSRHSSSSVRKHYVGLRPEVLLNKLLTRWSFGLSLCTRERPFVKSEPSTKQKQNGKTN